MSLSNQTMAIVQDLSQAKSVSSVIVLGSELIWGTAELVLSLGAIAAYAHLICFAVSLVMSSEDNEEASIDEETTAPRKHNTSALVLTGLLSGFHVMLVFFGLPLAGHGSDSFVLRLLFSCAILATVSTGCIVGGMLVYLMAPLLKSSKTAVYAAVKGSSEVEDVEDAAGEKEAELGFLEAAVYEKAA